jgi:hypothetical protein
MDKRRRRLMLRRAFAVLLLALALPSAFASALEEPAQSLEPVPRLAERLEPAALPAPLTAIDDELPPAVPPALAQPAQCPDGMALVDGEYCTEVEQECSQWLDDPELPFARCGEYAPSRCVGERKAMHFCIDRLEYTPPGESLPQNYASYQIASRVCRKLGKRLCDEGEWTFACEGEEMRPYPYGFTREAVCNYDQTDLYEMKKEKKTKKQVLKDLRSPSGAHPECVSPFGVLDMTGNMDEPTRRDQGAQIDFHNALKGGWWMAARNRCRPATTAHDDYYKDVQIGVRCCADAPVANQGPAG